MSAPAAGKVLVAGIGNIFLGDDGFGVEVARQLSAAGLPGWVTVADYGTSGMHLAYDLAGYDTAVLVDAAPRGGQPGTVTLLDVTPGSAGGDSPALAAGRLFDAHGMQPDLVLSVLDMLGAQAPRRILVVGCEPASTGYRIGLSEPVTAAVAEAVRIVRNLVAAAAGEHEGEHEGVTHVPRHSR